MPLVGSFWGEECEAYLFITSIIVTNRRQFHTYDSGMEHYHDHECREL